MCVGPARGECLLTLDDCIAFGELSRDVVLAIAEHERVPEMSAVAIGAELMRDGEGSRTIHKMLVSVINAAVDRGDLGYARALKSTLCSFLSENPAAAL